MEIRIGITNTGRELNFETNESSDAVKSAVAAALDNSASHVSFTDVKGNSYLVPHRQPGLRRARHRRVAPRRLRRLIPRPCRSCSV